MTNIAAGQPAPSRSFAPQYQRHRTGRISHPASGRVPNAKLPPPVWGSGGKSQPAMSLDRRLKPVTVGLAMAGYNAPLFVSDCAVIGGIAILFSPDAGCGDGGELSNWTLFPRASAQFGGVRSARAIWMVCHFLDLPLAPVKLRAAADLIAATIEITVLVCRHKSCNLRRIISQYGAHCINFIGGKRNVILAANPVEAVAMHRVDDDLSADPGKAFAIDANVKTFADQGYRDFSAFGSNEFNHFWSPPLNPEARAEPNRLSDYLHNGGIFRCQALKRTIPKTNTLSDKELGKRPVDTDELRKLAEIYGCEPWMLLAAPPKSEKLEQLKRAAGLIEVLPQKQVSAWLDIGDSLADPGK